MLENPSVKSSAIKCWNLGGALCLPTFVGLNCVYWCQDMFSTLLSLTNIRFLKISWFKWSNDPFSLHINLPADNSSSILKLLDACQMAGESFSWQLSQQKCLFVIDFCFLIVPPKSSLALIELIGSCQLVFEILIASRNLTYFQLRLLSEKSESPSIITYIKTVFQLRKSSSTQHFQVASIPKKTTPPIQLAIHYHLSPLSKSASLSPNTISHVYPQIHYRDCCFPQPSGNRLASRSREAIHQI